ncbi:MAG: hypothetical protein J6B79_01355 [Clostridia bacterium]|nr:hypothetical protein [Clostridia bacterium]
MKKMRRIISFVLALMSALCCFACQPDEDPQPFVSQFTIEEHIERIRNITEYALRYEIEKGHVKDIYIDALYQFDGSTPRQFLVEFEFCGDECKEVAHQFALIHSNKFTCAYLGYDTKRTHESLFRHYIVDTNRDTYLIENIAGVCGSNGFFGKSIYTELGYKESKKYYAGGRFGVLTEEGILQVLKICERYCCYSCQNNQLVKDRIDFEQKILSEEDCSKIKAYSGGDNPYPIGGLSDADLPGYAEWADGNPHC